MSRTRRLVVGSVAALSIGAFAPAAHAGLLVPSAENCDDAPASQVFLPWLDPANYVPAPGATAENKHGWNLDGASIVDGNEPWHVVSREDSRSLSIPAGASATTDTMCVGLEHPTLRYFVKQTGGSSLKTGLRTEVLFEGPAGVESLTIGYADGYGWHPTAQMVVTASLLPLLPGERTPVAFRFTAVNGNFQIDDVHVDPWGWR